jgi:ribosomal protein L34E
VIFIRNYEAAATQGKTEQTEITHEIINEGLCAILVYGIVPELMPHRAFRRDKHFKSAGKKIIKCPFCREKLTSVEATAKLELISYPKKDRHRVNWNKSMQCCNCSNVVGLIYLAA